MLTLLMLVLIFTNTDTTNGFLTNELENGTEDGSVITEDNNTVTVITEDNDTSTIDTIGLQTTIISSSTRFFYSTTETPIDSTTMDRTEPTSYLKTEMTDSVWYDAYFHVCTLTPAEDMARFTNVIADIENKMTKSEPSFKIKLTISANSHESNCENVYQRFSDCPSSFSMNDHNFPTRFNSTNRKKPKVYFIMTGPFCEIPTDLTAFKEFKKRILEHTATKGHDATKSYIMFTTTFNFFPISEDGYVAFPADLHNKHYKTANKLVMMLAGHGSYYADSVWHLMTNYFQWKRFVLIRIIGDDSSEESRDRLCKEIFSRIQQIELNYGDVFIEEFSWYLKTNDTQTKEEVFRNIWLSVAQITRVIYLCANLKNSGNFLKQIVANNVDGNKYGVIIMKTTLQDRDYFVAYLKEQNIEEALWFVKLITYYVELCDEYNLTGVTGRSKMEAENLTLMDRHRILKMDKLIGIYYCAVLDYVKHSFVRSMSLSLHDSFLNYYRKSDLKHVTSDKHFVMWYPVISLETYDENGFGEALRIRRDSTSGFKPVINTDEKMKPIRWYGSDEKLSDAPYFCNNRSTFYKCPVKEKRDFWESDVIYIGAFSASGLVVIICSCILCVVCVTCYNKKYLRRKWFLEANQLKNYEEQKGKIHTQPIKQRMTHVGMYKKIKVIVFDVKIGFDRTKLESKETLQEVARIAYFTRNNSNFAQLLGCTFSPPSDFKIVYKVGRGASLTQILRNVRLAVELKFSLIRDLARGLEFVKNSFLKCHGDLRTDRCMIDERFVLRVLITRFPKLDALIKESLRGTLNLIPQTSLWTSPELMRAPNSTPTEASDVYSFSIIMHEITYQHGPFYVESIHGVKSEHTLSASHFEMKFFDATDIDIEESWALGVIALVKSGPLRPTVPDQAEFKNLKVLSTLMKECWEETPEKRPKLNQILSKLQTHMKNNRIDVGNIGKRLEAISKNMVNALFTKKKQVITERDCALKYLSHLMPAHFGYEFMLGHTSHLQPDYYENVTIYFNDLMEFSNIMAHHKSYIEVIEILDELFIAYDTIVSFYDVVPLHRVGSSLLLASGVPHKNEKHASEIAQPALQIRHFAKNYKREKLGLRAGMHTGAIVSGIVGKNIPQFGLFGDTVNTASRMASTGEINEIQISEPVQKLLASTKNFIITSAGEKEIKGKGKMKTFWLKGFVSSNAPMERRLDDMPAPRSLADFRSTKSVRTERTKRSKKLTVKSAR